MASLGVPCCSARNSIQESSVHPAGDFSCGMITPLQGQEERVLATCHFCCVGWWFHLELPYLPTFDIHTCLAGSQHSPSIIVYVASAWGRTQDPPSTLSPKALLDLSKESRISHCQVSTRKPIYTYTAGNPSIHA